MKIFMATLFATLILSVGPAVAAPEDEVKAAFDRFVVAQNAHDVATVRELLWTLQVFCGSPGARQSGGVMPR